MIDFLCSLGQVAFALFLVFVFFFVLVELKNLIDGRRK